MELSGPPYLGAAYYPEDWPLDQIDDDIALMLEAGMNVMRVGEFAWSRMEPREGEYDFEWLHLVIEKLGQAGIATILGTPTCTPPAWLAERYPEILVMSDQGRRAGHGGRRHACPNSPVYREHCARIVTRMAEEFGHDPRVIGWQIDNELFPAGPRGCCCPVCHAKFQEAMRERFGTIEALNEAWGTHLWSQAYQDFRQLPIPRTDVRHHPSLLTAWMCFQSDSYIEFAHAQAEILHRLATQPVGTDMMPTGALNYHQMHRKLDVVQFNHYNSPENLGQAAFWMDLCRPIKEAPFWNTETSTCWNGGVTANGYKPSGFCRANSWLPIALGAEANLYWLWRAHWSGQELMHGSVISSCGRPLHIFGEVREVARGFRAAADFLNGTRVARPKVALHFSGFAWWLFEHQPMVNGFRYLDQLLDGFYRPLLQAQIGVDVIDPAASLEPYTVVCSPFLPALDEAGLRERLLPWLEAGGTWIAGPLTDIRTLDATKYRHAPYGSLEEWAGVTCRYQIPGEPQSFALRWRDRSISGGSVWYDGLEPHHAEAVATYADGPLKGLAGVTCTPVGKGQLLLLGTLPRGEDVREMVLGAGGYRAAEATPNLLVVPREGPGGRGLIVLDLGNQAGMLTLPQPATDLLTGRRHEGRIEVAPYGVMVLRY